MSTWHGGKGSNQRPTNRQRFAENYEAIFAKKAPENQVELDERIYPAQSNDGIGTSKLREHVEGSGILGQADQEQAVAWLYEKPLVDGFSELTLFFGYESEFEGVITPLYTHPPKRQPLSDDDIARLWGEKFSGESEMLRNFARAIENEHGIGD